MFEFTRLMADCTVNACFGHDLNGILERFLFIERKSLIFGSGGRSQEAQK